MDYLKGHRPALYTLLLLSGDLHTHLADLDEQGRGRHELIVKQMVKTEGVTEQRKVKNQMTGVGIMNSMAARTDEISRDEPIFIEVENFRYRPDRFRLRFDMDTPAAYQPEAGKVRPGPDIFIKEFSHESQYEYHAVNHQAAHKGYRLAAGPLPDSHRMHAGDLHRFFLHKPRCKPVHLRCSC